MIYDGDDSPSSKYHVKHMIWARSPPAASRRLKCSANDRRPSATKSNVDVKSASATIAVCSTRACHGSDAGTASTAANPTCTGHRVHLKVVFRLRRESRQTMMDGVA